MSTMYWVAFLVTAIMMVMTHIRKGDDAFVAGNGLRIHISRRQAFENSFSSELERKEEARDGFAIGNGHRISLMAEADAETNEKLELDKTEAEGKESDTNEMDEEMKVTNSREEWLNKAGIARDKEEAG